MVDTRFGCRLCHRPLTMTLCTVYTVTNREVEQRELKTFVYISTELSVRVGIWVRISFSEYYLTKKFSLDFIPVAVTYSLSLTFGHWLVTALEQQRRLWSFLTNVICHFAACWPHGCNESDIGKVDRRCWSPAEVSRDLGQVCLLVVPSTVSGNEAGNVEVICSNKAALTDAHAGTYLTPLAPNKSRAVTKSRCVEVRWSCVACGLFDRFVGGRCRCHVRLPGWIDSQSVRPASVTAPGRSRRRRGCRRSSARQLVLSAAASTGASRPGASYVLVGPTSSHKPVRVIGRVACCSAQCLLYSFTQDMID